jgi:hypothetical protein
VLWSEASQHSNVQSASNFVQYLEGPHDVSGHVVPETNSAADESNSAAIRHGQDLPGKELLDVIHHLSPGSEALEPLHIV